MTDSRVDLDELPYLAGHAWTLGDGVTAEQILPTAHRDRGRSVGTFAFAGLEASWRAQFAAGDFVVAGLDFGIGDATRVTARAVKLAGAGAVIARSFGDAFFAAAVHVGLPALQVEETGAIQAGDRLRVDIEGHKVVNLSSGDRYVIRNVYGEALDVLRAGGMAEYLVAAREHDGTARKAN